MQTHVAATMLARTGNTALSSQLARRTSFSLKGAQSQDQLQTSILHEQMKFATRTPCIRTLTWETQLNSSDPQGERKYKIPIAWECDFFSHASPATIISTISLVQHPGTTISRADRTRHFSKNGCKRLRSHRLAAAAGKVKAKDSRSCVIQALVSISPATAAPKRRFQFLYLPWRRDQSLLWVDPDADARLG